MQILQYYFRFNIELCFWNGLIRYKYMQNFMLLKSEGIKVKYSPIDILASLYVVGSIYKYWPIDILASSCNTSYCTPSSPSPLSM